MDVTNKIALFSCLLFSVSYVDAEMSCSIVAQGNSSYREECCEVSCGMNTTLVPSCYSSGTHGSGSGSGSSSGNGLEMICTEIEMVLGGTYKCNCSNLTCPPASMVNFTCTTNESLSMPTMTPTQATTTYSTSTTTTDEESTPTSSTTTIILYSTPTSRLTTSDEEPPTTTGEFTSTVSESTTTMELANDMVTLVLWIVLGCLIVLIIITLCAILLVSLAHCRRYKKKKQPTAMDIISKWEDTPNESSDIQLLSMKTVDEDEDKEQKDDHGVEKKEAERESSDEKSETKEVNKEDDVTVGTFGFAEKIAEPTASKIETPTTVTESEKKEDQSKKEEAAKVEKNEKLVEVTIEKAGESATNMGSRENPPPDNKTATGTDTTVSTQKEKAQEGTKLEPVPVQIPLVLGKQVADEKAPDSEQVAEVKTTEQSNKPVSPSKDKAVKPEISPSNSKDVSATESVSKEPESAATITKPQTEDVKTVSLASDKPPDGATGGFSLFTNEDMEKALGVAATIDLGQVESTQL